MDIKIRDAYRITSDSRNVILQEKRTIQDGDKAGEVYWNTLGYFGSLQGALKGLLNYQINTSEATTFKEIIDLIEEFKQLADELLT